MNVVYKLIDPEYFPKGITVIEASLPRVGETITLARYKGDDKGLIATRRVIEVRRTIMYLGRVDREESGMSRDLEVVLGPL